MKTDIAALLLRIKENIAAIESGDERAPLLDEVRSDFLELLELIKLFLISERDSYYGYFLMNMQFSVNYQSNSIAGIKLNTFPPVFESNPLLLCKFKLKEIIYVVCHEIDHIVLNHPAEMVKSNPEGDPEVFQQFNIAADASVNDRINYEIVAEDHHFMSAPNGLITSDSIAKMLGLKKIVPLENYSYYFNLIAQNGKEQDGMPQNGQQSMMKELGGGEPSDSSGQSGEGFSDEAESSDNGQSGKIVTANNCGDISDHDWQTVGDAEDAAAAVREFVNASVGMINEEKRGTLPGYFMSEVEKLNKPAQLPWQAILKKYIGTITAEKRKTRTRLNRRQPERFDLSGSVDDKLLKIVVAIDTSGSVNDMIISKILNEVFSILAKRHHDITVIECDSMVQRVYKAKTPADIKEKVAGRGGTMFTPVIDYINRDKYFRDALLIYFTDGYGEYEIPRPKTYRNMWVVFGGAWRLSLKEPYGVVLSME